MRGKNGKGGRQWTVDEKLKVLEEARAPKTTVASVLRRHQLDATTFYRWEREARQGMRDALGAKPRTRDTVAQENERLKAELTKKSQIIAEVVAENLALKGGL